MEECAECGAECTGEDRAFDELSDRDVAVCAECAVLLKVDVTDPECGEPGEPGAEGCAL